MSAKWEIISRHSDYVISLDGEFAPAKPEIEEAAVNAWTQAVRKNPSLVNGELLALKSIVKEPSRTIVHCIKTQYRYYYVSMFGIDLGAALDPLAVSGAIRVCDGGNVSYIVARRSKNVAIYKNCLEFVPSGGIDGDAIRDDGSVDFISQLRREFEEETGILKTEIKNVEPFAFIHDSGGRVYDICARIDIDWRESYKDTLVSASSGEYSDAVLVPENELKNFVKRRAHEFVPSSLAIARLLALR